MKYADILFRYSDPITLKYFLVPLKCIENASKMASRHPKQYAFKKGNIQTFYLQFFYLSTQEMIFVPLCNPSDFKLDRYLVFRALRTCLPHFPLD